jgi:hypothetical protein
MNSRDAKYASRLRNEAFLPEVAGLDLWLYTWTGP